MSVIEKLSRLEGELRGSTRTASSDLSLQVEASIDAIHYSTKIEGNALTREQVNRATTGSPNRKSRVGRDLREVLNYSKARQSLFLKAANNPVLNCQLILDYHRTLVSGVLSGKLRGHFREAQNAVTDSKTRSIVYLPPVAKDVFQLTNSLCKGISREMSHKEASPLISAAAFHFQFVTIHPFMDGNGRLARLLSTYILASRGYEFVKYASIEKQHETDRTRYYKELRILQAGNYYDIPKEPRIDSWILYWLQCALGAAQEAVENLYRVSVKKEFPLSRRLQQALGLFRKHGTLTAQDYQNMTGLGRTQAVSDLGQLDENGLVVRTGGGRSTRYALKK